MYDYVLGPTPSQEIERSLGCFHSFSNVFLLDFRTEWPKENVQKDKQRSTKHTYKTKDRVTGIPLKPRGELRCSGGVSSSCFTSGTSRVNLVTNPVFSIKVVLHQVRKVSDHV
jgi:hypothetical protein